MNKPQEEVEESDYSRFFFFFSPRPPLILQAQ